MTHKFQEQVEDVNRPFIIDKMNNVNNFPAQEKTGSDNIWSEKEFMLILA